MSCGRLGLNGDFQYTIAALPEESIGFNNVRKRKSVRQQRLEVDPPMEDQVHQSTHAFFSAGTQGCDDAVISDAGGKGIVGNLQFARIHAKTR